MHTRWWQTWRDGTAMGTPATMQSGSSHVIEEDGRSAQLETDHTHAYVDRSQGVGADGLRTARFHRFNAVGMQCQ
jgi:hypothetical protein